MIQNEYQNIFEFYAGRAFDNNNQLPQKPEKKLFDLIKFKSYGYAIEQAMVYYLLEQNQIGLFNGLSDTEIATRFVQLFDLGIFMLKIFPGVSGFLFDLDIKIQFLIWDGEEYQDVNEAIFEYLDILENRGAIFEENGESNIDYYEEEN